MTTALSNAPVFEMTLEKFEAQGDEAVKCLEMYSKYTQETEKGSMTITRDEATVKIEVSKKDTSTETFTFALNTLSLQHTYNFIEDFDLAVNAWDTGAYFKAIVTGTNSGKAINLALYISHRNDCGDQYKEFAFWVPK